MRIAFGVAWLAISPAVAAGPPAPPGLAKWLPAGYRVLTSVRMVVDPARTFQIVALARVGEDALTRSGDAPARPLMIFKRRGEVFELVGRNDAVVLKADEGGQCDPFLDGGGTISVTGRFFTVENGVACGQHWTDFVTFRLDDRTGFVFDNERSESWSLNPSGDPDAEALVRDGPQRVVRARPGSTVLSARWRRAR